MRVIVNADDLGASTGINAAIFDLMSARIVTSATILANSPAAEEALERIRSYPHCSFGVHLNLTEFEPLTSSPAFNAIVDEKRCFKGNIRDVPLDPVLRDAIFTEWCAQVKKAQSYGIKVSHLDSHHHVHTIPQLFMMLKRVQQAFGIRKVRITRNIYSTGSHPLQQLLLKKKLWNFALKHYYATRTASGFTDFATFFQVGKSARLPHETVEVMVHPGRPDFSEETTLLQTPWLAEMPFDTSLINYHEL